MTDSAARRVVITGMGAITPIGNTLTEYWEGLIDWIKNTMLSAGNISATDLDLIKIVDTEDEVVKIIDAFYKGHTLSPNF